MNNNSIDLQLYTNKNDYLELFNKYTTSGNLLENIKLVSDKLAVFRGALTMAKSESAYWGLISDVCLYEDLQYALIATAFDILKSYDCKKMKPYLEAKDRLDKIILNKDQVVKDLNKYKPSGYKSKIELLEDIFNE